MRPTNPFVVRDYGSLVRVSDRVFIWRNIVNSAVFVGDNGIAVIDTQVNHALARRLRDRLAKEFAKPILYAINTHYHWDHTNGNAVFAEQGATIVASKRTAAAMVERAPRQKGFLSSRGFELGPDPQMPSLYADDRRRLDLGGLSLELTPGHDAETADPTLVWCPEERCLAAGDTVMTGSFPIFGQPSQREGLENRDWLAALDQVRGFASLAVLPGHGPVAHSDELAMQERIMRYFLDEVPKHRTAGRNLIETMRVMEDEMPAWITRISEVWGTPRYAILRVWCGLEDLGQPGFHHVKPSAIPRAASLPLPTNTDHSAWRGTIAQLIEGGDAAGAVTLAETAAQRFASNPDAHVDLARTLISASRSIASVLEKGDCFQAARTALATALTLKPDYGPALLQEGQFFVMMAYRNGDDTTRGEALLEQAAADKSLSARERAEIEFYRAIATRTRGNEAEAKLAFARSLAIDPSFKPAFLAQMA